MRLLLLFATLMSVLAFVSARVPPKVHALLLVAAGVVLVLAVRRASRA